MASSIAVVGAGVASVGADLALARFIGNQLDYEIGPSYEVDLYLGLAGFFLYSCMSWNKRARQLGWRVLDWASPLVILRILHLKNGKPKKAQDEDAGDH